MQKYMCTKHANVEYMNASRDAHTVFPRVSKIIVAFIIFIFFCWSVLTKNPLWQLEGVCAQQAMYEGRHQHVPMSNCGCSTLSSCKSHCTWRPPRRICVRSWPWQGKVNSIRHADFKKICYHDLIITSVRKGRSGKEQGLSFLVYNDKDAFSYGHSLDYLCPFAAFLYCMQAWQFRWCLHQAINHV